MNCDFFHSVDYVKKLLNRKFTRGPALLLSHPHPHPLVLHLHIIIRSSHLIRWLLLGSAMLSKCSFLLLTCPLFRWISVRSASNVRVCPLGVVLIVCYNLQALSPFPPTQCCPFCVLLTWFVKQL